MKRLAWLALLLLSFPSGPARASVAPVTPVEIQKTLAFGDDSYRKRDNPVEARKALLLYREAFARRPESAEAGWRLAMACYFVGNRLTVDEDEKEKIHLEGVKAGEASLKADFRCASCHFWTAINLALHGETVGSFKTLNVLPKIREHLKKSIDLDPGYASAGAYRTLGLIEEKLPGILGGSNDRARSYYQSAISAAPNEPLNYFFLARLLAEEFDEKAEARKLILKGLSSPSPKPEYVESREAVQDLMKLRDRLASS